MLKKIQLSDSKLNIDIYIKNKWEDDFELTTEEKNRLSEMIFNAYWKFMHEKNSKNLRYGTTFYNKSILK